MCNDRPENPSIMDQLIGRMDRPDHEVLVEVSRELLELKVKIIKREHSLYCDQGLPETQKKLLVCQLKYMKEYAKTLSLRIEDLSIAIREDIDKSSDSE